MPTAAEAKTTMANRALVNKLGLAASYSIGQNTTLGTSVDFAWTAVEARVPSLYHWSYMRKTVKLNRLASVDNGWPYGYDLPAERIGDPLAYLRSVTVPDDYVRNYMVEAGQVYAMEPALWARIRVASDPTTWDAGFAEAFVTALGSALAVSLLQDEDREMSLFVDAFGRPQENGTGGMFGRLIAMNKAAQPQGRRFLDDDPLTAARRG